METDTENPVPASTNEQRSPDDHKCPGEDNVLVTPAAIVHSVVDRFLVELSRILPNVKADGPARISFPCFASHDLVPIIIRRIQNILPGNVILVDTGTMVDRRATTFVFVLRRLTEAEKILGELLPLSTSRLSKSVNFASDVQVLSWSVRNIRKLTWDMFQRAGAKTEKMKSQQNSESEQSTSSPLQGGGEVDENSEDGAPGPDDMDELLSRRRGSKRRRIVSLVSPSRGTCSVGSASRT